MRDVEAPSEQWTTASSLATKRFPSPPGRERSRRGLRTGDMALDALQLAQQAR